MRICSVCTNVIHIVNIKIDFRMPCDGFRVLLTWPASRAKPERRLRARFKSAYAFIVVVVHSKFITNWKYFDTTVTNQMQHFIRRTVTRTPYDRAHTSIGIQAVCLFVCHFSIFFLHISRAAVSLCLYSEMGIIHYPNVFTATYVLCICLIIWEFMLPLHPSLRYE